MNTKKKLDRNSMKERIYNFLLDHRGEKFFLKEAAEKSKISYPTFQKWIYVLASEKNRSPRILMEDKGRTKFVWAEQIIE
ncbi:MAG: hypothetical protein ACFFG0_07935 [Candidatus Thorarchaeota archaeon]